MFERFQMKTNNLFAMRSIAITALVSVIGFAFITCDDGNGNTHTHSYSTTWSSNATQHWHECTANDGAKTDLANHTGNPCTVCGYSTPVAPTITTTTLAGGTVGTPYSQTLTATGDTPITWTLDSGTLPTSLSLSTAGVISGTPTTVGTSTFTVIATNATGNDTKSLSIVIGNGTVANPIPLTPNTFVNGNITSSSGGAYWYTFNVISGTTYYVWWVDSDIFDEEAGNPGPDDILDIKVAAYYNSSTGTEIFDVDMNSNEETNEFNTISFTATSTGTVYIKVYPYSSDSTGTFAVAYSTTNTRPNY